MRVLILGGTTEGRVLAEALAGDCRFVPIYSLAGRTGSPLLPGARSRIGGFGGPAGLAAWLRTERVDVLLDATHPYAARISANAVCAAAECGLPLLRLQREPWHAEPQDDWREVVDAAAAADALGTRALKVLLTIGRNGVAAFRAARQHSYVIRAVDAPDPASLPPGAVVLLQRGPFAVEDELQLMRRHRIEVVVSKNSGGEAAYGKIVAARQLGLPVVMISRPPQPAAEDRGDVRSALAWLDTCWRAAHAEKPSERGV